MQIIPVVLAGGIGARLWPYSRPDFPKPFISLPNEIDTLFSNTLKRALKLKSVKDVIVISNEKYRYLVKHEEESVCPNGKYLNIWEPEGKNTAAAIAIAAKVAIEMYGEESVLLVLPADHSIGLMEEFSKTVIKAAELACQDYLVTFGIKPTRAESGYGYIKFCDDKVEEFIEKPTEEVARALIEAGNVAWNAGIFCFKVKKILAEIQKYFPELFVAIEKLSVLRIDDGELTFTKDSFARLPSASIDYAIMEKSDSLAIVPCSIEWDDIGSWTSFEKLYRRVDEKNNTIYGKVEVIDSKDNLILGGERLIAAVGVDNLVVVSTEGATLIANRNSVQDVKKLTDLPLVKNNPYAKVQRPWGSYQVLDQGPGYKVKRIEIVPGGMLSLQVHKHRDEHWTMVCGVANVTRGDDILKLGCNESILIPRNEKHRLHNFGDTSCILIEVQSGEYLGEDDIIRLEDVYRRF